MNYRKDPVEDMIVEDLLYQSEMIEKEMEGNEIEMPEGVEEEIRRKLHEQIDEYERKRIYAQLSEEDRKALELGKEMLKDRLEDTKERVVYRKRHKKTYVAVAAVAVLVMAMGVTSIGGAKKIAEVIGVKIGNREITRVETEDDNYIDTNEDEEIAYQEVKDTFGVEPVKIVHWPGRVQFLEGQIDEELQTALLIYKYNEEIISYYISSHYTKSSWGVDVEDKVTDRYSMEVEENTVKIKEYETPETKSKVYSASFGYNGLEYYLVGMFEKTEFEEIIKNLIFL